MVGSVCWVSSQRNHSPFMQVRNLRVETHPDDPVAPPIWDGCGLVYGRMARATPDGQDGKVQIVTSRSALDSEQLALGSVALPDDSTESGTLLRRCSWCCLMLPFGWLQLMGYA